MSVNRQHDFKTPLSLIEVITQNAHERCIFVTACITANFLSYTKVNSLSPRNMVRTKTTKFRSSFHLESKWSSSGPYLTAYLSRLTSRFVLRFRHVLSNVLDSKHAISWKHFLRYWLFVREIHRSPVNYLHKGLWCGALMFSLICAWISGWVNKGEVGDVDVMKYRWYIRHIFPVTEAALFWSDARPPYWRRNIAVSFISIPGVNVACKMAAIWFEL